MPWCNSDMFIKLLLSSVALSQVTTNSVSIADAPKWLTAARVNKVSGQIERALEWDIRRVRVRWFTSDSEFSKAVGLPGDTSSVLAVAKRNENAIYIGPRVKNENFDAVFGHELAHVIMFQKYKDAIPKWLEEGLANYVAKRGEIDYRFLAANENFDVRSMTHPFQAASGKSSDPKLHYMASSAVMHMIASKCRIHDLLQLSVGHGLEKYLSTFCRIPDLNAEFAKWVKRKANAQ